jgi:hypothetical protein
MSGKKQLRNGKAGSTPTKSPSKRKEATPRQQLQRVLRTAYNTYQRLDDPAANLEARHDFVFHMTDWAYDLERLASLYARPEAFDKDEAGDRVFRFLIHALPHLLAAGRLLLGKVSDPFGDQESPR